MTGGAWGSACQWGAAHLLIRAILLLWAALGLLRQALAQALRQACSLMKRCAQHAMGPAWLELRPPSTQSRGGRPTPLPLSLAAS